HVDERSRREPARPHRVRGDPLPRVRPHGAVLERGARLRSGPADRGRVGHPARARRAHSAPLAPATRPAAAAPELDPPRPVRPGPGDRGRPPARPRRPQLPVAVRAGRGLRGPGGPRRQLVLRGPGRGLAAGAATLADASSRAKSKQKEMVRPATEDGTMTTPTKTPADAGEQQLFSATSFPEMYEQALVGALFDPWVALLLDDVALAPGDRLLDVACGTGIAARRARERLGEGATVVGVDVNPGMLGVARRV